MTGILYRIWLEYKCANKFKPPYVVIDEEKGTWAYPLVELVDCGPWSSFYRDDLISNDREKLQPVCDYLNRIADEGQHYDIREQLVEVF